MRIFNRAALALALLALGPVQARAADGPYCQIDPGKPKFYRLELSVPTTFCMNPDSRSDPSCQSFPKPGLQLHGLWPNYHNGYPSGECDKKVCPTQSDAKGKFCAYPQPPGLYQSAEWKQGKQYMAGLEKCLERHEWVKHGTCTTMQPAAYFGWALKQTQAFADAVAPLLDRPVSRQEFDQLIEKKFPALNGAVRLKCRGAYVDSLNVQFEWGSEPGAPIKTRGGDNGYGNCGKTFTFPSKI